MTLIFDGDYPLAYGAFDLNRDPTLPLAELRAQDDSGVEAFACFPEMRRGGVAVALMKIAVRQLREGSVLPGTQGEPLTYATAQGHLAYYHALEAAGEAVVITAQSQLAEHIGRWEEAAASNDDAALAALPVGMIIGLESADPILTPGSAGEWWEAGVRVVSLTHYGPTRYAWGTGTTGGLTGLGPPLLREMERLGMILDLTHISDESFWEAVEVYQGVVIASHQNCREICPGQRQFSDDQLRVVIERGGVVGASMDTWMIRPVAGFDWGNTEAFARRDYFTRDAVTLEHLVDHIDHVCQLAGNAKHAAIGGDTDGQGGTDGAPLEIDSVADYQKIVPILSARGYSADDVADIMYRNWQRVYGQHLPA
ncbi:MAG: peptidase M19 [Dehalococcoidia bacterium]|nr:peptidase M19 [Dehalococcoidia bacterium]